MGSHVNTTSGAPHELPNFESFRASRSEIDRATLDEAFALDTGSGSTPFDGVITSTCTMPFGSGMHGGDWCETFPLARGSVGVSIGGVSGPGHSAFDGVGSIRAAIRRAASDARRPLAETLADANAVLFAYKAQATAIYGVLNPDAGTFTFINAGHTLPLTVAGSGANFVQDSESDPPLGIVRESALVVHRLFLNPETLLVLYTDGVTGADYGGVQRLRDAAVTVFHTLDVPIASAIVTHMLLSAAMQADVALLAAWIPAISRLETIPPTKLTFLHHRWYGE